MKSSMLLVICALLIVAVRSAPLNETKNDDVEFLILHNNDMHSRFEQTSAIRGKKCDKKNLEINNCYGGFARMANKIREYRKKAERGEGPPVLVLNAGDTYTGTTWFALYKEKIAADFMNILEPNATTLGNHEFDEGSKNIAAFINSVKFPVIVSNLDISKETNLLNVTNLVKSAIFEIKGAKIGVIGYVTPETKSSTVPNNIEFLDEIKSISSEVKVLKDKGVNIFIGLGHSGFDKDKEIAAKIPEMDVVIGAHTHSFLYTGPQPDIEKPEDFYPTIVVQASGKKVPVVQAYAFTKYLGYFKVKFSNAGNLIEHEGQPILLAPSVPQEKDVLELLDKYRGKIDALEMKYLGKTKVMLDNNCRQQECNLGNLITDAMVYANTMRHQSISEVWTDATIAFLNSGGIKAPIDTVGSQNGNITQEDVAAVLPYNDYLFVVELTGREIKEALENSVQKFGRGNGGFLQLSGIKVNIDLSRQPRNRVIRALVLCSKCIVPKYEMLSLHKTYRAVISSFLNDGGDGYTMFKKPPVRELGLTNAQSLAEYIEKEKIVYIGVENRIVLSGG